MKSPKPPENATLAQMPEFYTNALHVNVSAFDIEVNCFLVDSSQNVKSGLVVRMSPQTAESFSKLLVRELEELKKKPLAN